MANTITNDLLIELQDAIVESTSLVGYASVSGKNTLSFNAVNLTGTVFALQSARIVIESSETSFKFYTPNLQIGGQTGSIFSDSGVNSVVNFFDSSDNFISAVNFSSFTGTIPGSHSVTKVAGAVKASLTIIQNVDSFQGFPSQYISTFNEQAYVLYESEAVALSFATPNAANGLLLNQNAVFTINQTTDYDTILDLFSIYTSSARTTKTMEIDIDPAVTFSADGTYTVTTLTFNFSCTNC